MMYFGEYGFCIINEFWGWRILRYNNFYDIGLIGLMIFVSNDGKFLWLDVFVM